MNIFFFPRITDFKILRDTIDKFHHCQLPIHINKISFSDYIIFLFCLHIGLCSFFAIAKFKKMQKGIRRNFYKSHFPEKNKRYDRMPGYFWVRFIRHVKSSFCLVYMEDMLGVLSKYCKFSPRKEEGNSLKTFHLKYLLKPKSFFLCLNAFIAYIILAWGGQSVGLDDLCRSLTTEKTSTLHH